jgi:hypothetical protein
MSLFDDIRKVAPWTKDLSDEEIVAKGVELTGAPLKDVAATLGYQAPTSDFGKELSAGFAGYKAGLEHIGGALGSDTAKQWAAQNEAKAEVLRGLSNAPHSYEDVKFGDKDKGVLNYLGALAAGSAPYIAEQALFTLGDVATGGALTPAHAARIGEIGATIARKAAGKSAAEIAAANTAKDSLAQGITRTVVGTEVGYPSSVGQLLQNQYEESKDYNLGAAAAMGVPYSMLNQVGIEGAVARGGLNVANLAKRPMRALGTGLITAAEESGGEVGQAFLENVAKKSVNADYDLTGEDAFRNLRESAVGGFALGGVTGGIGGALSRKPGSLAKDSNNLQDIGGTPDGNAVNAAIDQNSPEVTATPVPQAPMQVTPSGDVLVTPAQQQAYQDFGQSQLGIKAQQEAAAKQQEAQIIQTVKSFGGVPNPAGGIDIAGKRLYGQEQANKFATELQQAMEGRSETDMSLASAVVRSGLANIKQTAGVKQLINSVGKVLDTYQIGHVDTVEEAAATLNDQIGRLEGASALKEAERINSLFTALTGQSAPEFAKIQEAVAAQEAAKTTKGKKNERLQLQQQSDAGVRAVPEQGGTAEVRGTTVGDVRPTSVQSVEPGSVGAGQVSQQVRAVPSEGVPAGASANVTGPNLASVQAQGQVNEQGTSSQEGRGAQDIGQTTGSVEAETEAEKAAGTVKRIVNKILDAVVKRQGRMSNERLVKYKEFLSMYMGGINPNLHFSAEELAAQFGVSVDTIDGWNKSAKNFFEANKGVIVAQFEQAAAAEGMTTQQVYEMMTAKYEAEAKEVAALEEGQYLTEATNQEDEQAFEEKAATAADTEVSTVDKRELQAEDSGMKVVSGRTGASIQEVHKAAETVNARITKLLTEQNEAYREGDDARGDALQEEIDKLTVEATKLNAKEVRKSEEKAPKKRKKVKDAVQEPSTKKVPVRERTGSSEGVRQEDTKREEPTRARKTEAESKAEEQEVNAWNAVAPIKYDQLSAQAKADWAVAFKEGKTNLAAANKVYEENKESIEKSTAKAPTTGSKAEDIKAEIKGFINAVNTNRLMVVQSVSDLPKNVQARIEGEKPQGLVVDGAKAYLIADNIEAGNARAVFMHEVGAHLGIQKLLTEKQFDNLVDTLNTWAGKKDGSIESELAIRALARASKVSIEQANTEFIAYFVEEAVKVGIDPTALKYNTKLEQWFTQLFKAIKTVISRLGIFNPNKMSAKDVVDLAYGAAHLAMVESIEAQETTEPSIEYSKAFDKARAQAQSTVNKLPPSLRGPVRGIWSALFNVKEAGLSAMITKDVVEMAEKYMPSAANFLKAHELRTQITREHEQHLSKIKVAFDKLDEATGKKVNDIIAASTTSGEWAFDPEIKGAKINFALNKKFEALPDAAQKIIEDVFMSSRKDLKDMQAAVRESVDNAFAEKLAAATTPDEQKAVEKEKAKMLKSFSGILGINNITPYAPLKRFGSFVVVAKSQQYRDAEANGDTKEIEKLQSDENHFIVEFAETAGEAEEIYDNLAARNQYAELERPFKKSEARESLYSGTDLFKGFAKLKRVIASQKTEEAGNEVLNKLESMVNELYLLSLADSSARKAQLQRKNISGFDRDMMRAFFTQSAANAHYIANLKTSDAVLDSVVAMQKEAASNRAGAYPFLNELMMREAQSLEIREPSMLDAANRLTSDWFLTFSPAFYLQQATQTYVLSLPWLAGKYQYAKASAAITKAYQDILPIVKGIDLKEHVDLSTAPEDVRDMLKTLVGRGRIDIGVEVETAGHRSEKGNVAAATYSKVTNTLRGAINRLETINRATAAIAAYRLEMAKSGDKAKATEAADQVVHVTHGSYDGFNTPRLFGKSGFTRSIFQFRRFQVIQLSMLARMMSKAFMNGTKEEKAVARKQLAFLVSHTMVLGGMKGMPFYVLGSFAYSLLKGLFGDSEDPEDFEAWLRKHGGLLLARGVPAWMGLDVSGKLGMGNVMSILPYTEVDLTSRGGIEKAALGAMGPFIGGLLPKMADGAGLVGRGDYYKGLEQMMPNGVSNAMKGIRFATEGITLRNGDVVVPPEEISFMQAIMQGLGLPTAGITERSYAQNEVRKMDKYYGDKESEIKYQYAKAYKAGNSSALAEARQEWALVQQSKREQGIKASPLSELIKAPMAQQKRERSVIGGVESKLGNRQMVRNIVEG